MSPLVKGAVPSPDLPEVGARCESSGRPPLRQTGGACCAAGAMPSDDSDRSSDALVADEPVDGGAQAAGRGAKREWNTPDWTANGESIVRAFLRSEGVDSLGACRNEKTNG